MKEQTIQSMRRVEEVVLEVYVIGAERIV